MHCFKQLSAVTSPWSDCCGLLVSFWLPVSLLLKVSAKIVKWNKWLCCSQNKAHEDKALPWKVLHLLVSQHRKIWRPRVQRDSTQHMQNAWEAQIVIWWLWLQMRMIPKPIVLTQVVGLKPQRIIQITMHALSVLVRMWPYILTAPVKPW